MVFHMKAKTTLSIDPALMREVKAEAARRGITMSDFVATALRLVLVQPAERSERKLPPLPSWSSGGALVDISDRDALYEAMERD
jgi:hypothetical protein